MPMRCLHKYTRSHARKHTLALQNDAFDYFSDVRIVEGFFLNRKTPLFQSLLKTSGFAARHIGPTTVAHAPSVLDTKYTYTQA